MRCPNCGTEPTRILQSRPTNNNAVRRRRLCTNCGKRFTTFEIPHVMTVRDFITLVQRLETLEKNA